MKPTTLVLPGILVVGGVAAFLLMRSFGGVQQVGATTDPRSFHELRTRTLEGEPADLSQYDGKVALVVNVASKCGYTPQYEGLQELYDRYGERGLVVLGFPSNDFGNQEPGAAEEIANFCRLNYGVTFPMMAKVHTKGPAQAPIYQMLTTESAEEFRGEVQWNFTKFLVDGDGRVVARFDSAVEPLDPQITAAVEALLIDEGP